MAKAVFEKRSFTNRQTGEIVSYEWYGIIGTDSQGELMELNLTKLMDSANKIAFKVVTACDDPIDMSNTNVDTRKASESEIKQHQSQIKKTSSTTSNDAFNLEEEDSIDPNYFDKDDED